LFNSRYFLITWSQNSAPKEEVWRNVKEDIGKLIDKAVIGAEKHKDGGDHLHMFLLLKERKAFRASAVDKWANGVANIRLCTAGDYSLSRVALYASKENNFLEIPGTVAWATNIQENGPHKDEKKESKTGKMSKEVYDLFLKGVTVQQVLQDHPEWAVPHLKKLQELRSFMEFEKSLVAPPELPWIGMCLNIPTPEYCPKPWAKQIVSWFEEHASPYFPGPTQPVKTKRPLRTPQLWVRGPPGIGKTTLIAHLTMRLRVYLPPPSESWCDEWVDGSYHVAVFDEFGGNRPLTWMNQWLDGSHLPLSRRGRAPVVKKQNIPTIIFSNRLPTDVYHAAAATCNGSVDALVSRLCLVDIPDGTLGKITNPTPGSTGSDRFHINVLDGDM